MIQRIISVVFVGLILFSGTAMASNPEKEEAAALAAKQWLATVDAGKYAESWKESAEFFRNAITSEHWEQSLRAVRTPLGKTVSRKVLTKSYKTSLPGVPDGDYVVIQFSTSFEHKKAAIETVTPMMDLDGKWRVSGYYIK